MGAIAQASSRSCSRAVIETLLRLGAKSGPAMTAALKVKDPAVLEALSNAGADLEIR
jgi:hypothetical protein